jgi:hypothetical protein
VKWETHPNDEVYELNMIEVNEIDAQRGFVTNDGKWVVISNFLKVNEFTVTWESHKIRPTKYYAFRVRAFLKSQNAWVLWEDR